MKLSIALAYAYANAIFGPKVTASPIMGSKGEEDKHDHDERGRGRGRGLAKAPFKPAEFLKGETKVVKEMSAKAKKHEIDFNWSAMEEACKEICAKFPGTYAKTDGIDYVFIPSGAVRKGGASLKVFAVGNTTNPCVYTAELNVTLVDGSSTERGTITYGGNSFGCTGALQLRSQEPFSSVIDVRLLPKTGNIEAMMSGAVPALSTGSAVAVPYALEAMMSGAVPVLSTGSAVTGPYELVKLPALF